MIKVKSYNLQLISLTPKVLQKYTYLFWHEVFRHIDHRNSYLTLMVKVRFDTDEMSYKSIAKLRSVGFTDKNLFVDYICDNLGLLTDGYTSTAVRRLDFTYYVHKGEVTSFDRSLLALRKLDTVSTVPTHSIKKSFLPLSMEPKDFGKILSEVVSKEGNPVYIINGSGGEIFEIEILSGGLTVKGKNIA